MNRFLISLLSGDERGVNSIITCGVGSLMVHFGMTIYTGVMHGIYDAGTFVTGIVGIIAVISGGKTVHDRWSSGMQLASVASPDGVATVESKP